MTSPDNRCASQKDLSPSNHINLEHYYPRNFLRIEEETRAMPEKVRFAESHSQKAYVSVRQNNENVKPSPQQARAVANRHERSSTGGVSVPKLDLSSLRQPQRRPEKKEPAF